MRTILLYIPMKSCGKEAVEVLELNEENRIWNIITIVHERHVEGCLWLLMDKGKRRIRY